jgi:hypothetical protein
MTKRTAYFAAVAGAAALALGGAALVQAATPATPAPGAPAASSAAHPGWQAMREQRQARHAERAKLLRDALNLKPAQEKAWTTFQAAMQPPAGMGPRGDRMNPQAKQAMTTPQRLDRMADMMARRQAMFAERAKTVKTFYAVLDSAQQRTFDAFTARGMGGMGMMGHGRRGHRGMGHGRMGSGQMGPGHMGPPPEAPPAG